MHWLRAWQSECRIPSQLTLTRIQTHAFLLTQSHSMCVCASSLPTPPCTLISCRSTESIRRGRNYCFPGLVPGPTPQADLDVENSIHVMSIFCVRCLHSHTQLFFYWYHRLVLGCALCVCARRLTKSGLSSRKKGGKKWCPHRDEVFMGLRMRACDNQGRNRL